MSDPRARRRRVLIGRIGLVVLLGALAGVLTACSDDDAASPDTTAPFPAFADVFGDQVPAGEVVGLLGVEPDALPDGYSGLALEAAEIADAPVGWLVHDEDVASDVSQALEQLGDRLEEVARADGLVLESLAPTGDDPTETSTPVADPSESTDVPDAPASPEAPDAQDTATPSDSPPLDGTVAVTVQPGDSFWSLASDAVTTELGRSATTGEITAYWASLIEANADQLVEPGNPDLIHPGQVFDLPPV